VSQRETTSDIATTFTEAELSIETSVSSVTDSAIVSDSTIVSRSGDNSTSTDTNAPHGLTINPNVDLEGVAATISGNTSGASTVDLYDTSGTKLASEAFPGTGSTVTLHQPLASGTSYYLVVDGDNFDLGFFGSPSYPYESASIDIPQNVAYSGGWVQGDSLIYAFSSIEPTATAFVEWPEPDPISRWETATYQADIDGGRVDVYVETSSDDGSNWSDWRPEPITRGTDLSSIPADNRVRFRAELLQDDASNDPRVTLLSRQWRP